MEEMLVGRALPGAILTFHVRSSAFAAESSRDIQATRAVQRIPPQHPVPTSSERHGPIAAGLGPEAIEQRPSRP